MKNKNTPIIPELTRSGYRAFFENFDDSWEFEPTYPLKKNEPKIVEALRLKFGEDVQIFAVREVSEPDGVSMPDLIFNGEKTEIKTISSKRSIERQVRKAYIQKSSAIVFDISNLLITDAEMLKKVEFEASRRGISHFGFFDGEKIIHKNEKKENSLTELYPKQDQTASGFIISQNGKKIKIASTNSDELGIKIKKERRARHPQSKGSVNISSFSVSIIPPNSEKINSIFENKKEVREMREIKDLPKKYYKQVYGEDYDPKTWKLRFSGLNKSEIGSIKSFFKDIKPNEIFWIPEVDYPQGVHTPDIYTDGVYVEIKNITSVGSVGRQLKKAHKQISDGFVIVNAVDSSVDTDLLKSALMKESHFKKINTVLVKGDKVLALNYISKKSLDSANRPISEAKPFYALILAQKHEKVNHESIKTLGISPKLIKKPAEYWRARSLQRTVEVERQSLPYLRKLKEEYARSSNRAIDNVRRIYENYMGKNSFDRQKLREIVPSGEFNKYLKEVRALGVELPDNYNYRVSREEFAQAQLWLEAQKLGVFENQLGTELYSKVINQSFEKTFGDYGVNFAGLNKQAMNRILNAKFYGENFSTRIWGRTDSLADELQAKLAFAVAKGQSWEKTSREIRERFDVSQSSAERLIRTETNYFENSAEIEAYDELGIKEFEFLAALDGRTSKICRHHHGKRFKVKDAKAGVNTPPLHPNCRSTIVAVVEGLEGVPQKEKPRTEENRPQKEESLTAWKSGVIDFSKLSRTHPDYMYPHEQDFYERAVKKYGKVERIPLNKGEITNDFIIDGKEWELKSILNEIKSMTVRNEIYRATDKGKRNIFIDVYGENIDIYKTIERAKKHVSIKKNNEKIDNLVVVISDEFIKIK